jgi:uncharacterized protein (TIGR02391 family)
MAQFLAGAPPGESVFVVDVLERRNALMGSLLYLNTPLIGLHCSQCGGIRNFNCIDEDFPVHGSGAIFRTYVCRNCGQDHKLFALWIERLLNAQNIDGPLLKIGEYPPFNGYIASAPANSTHFRFADLHPQIGPRCLPLFDSRAYAEAVEKGFKVVRDRLRALSGYETGSDAFGKARLKIRGAAALHVEEDFNEGVKFLTMAIDKFRNEKAHCADGNIQSPLRAYEYLRLSSLAMHLLDNAYKE